MNQVILIRFFPKIELLHSMEVNLECGLGNVPSIMKFMGLPKDKMVGIASLYSVERVDAWFNKWNNGRKSQPQEEFEMAL